MSGRALVRPRRNHLRESSAAVLGRSEERVQPVVSIANAAAKRRMTGPMMRTPSEVKVAA
jgi:hypothetical protein